MSTFTTPIKHTIQKYDSDTSYSMTSMDSGTQFSDEDIRDIAKICSEKRVYDVLFKEKFEGRPYTGEDARRFVNWAQSGWENDSHYVFIIRDGENHIAGAVDIKSADLAGAEIGYWASENHPGIMTNAVRELCKIASNVGYKSLFGLVVPHNNKSQGVLLRAGFENLGNVHERGKEYIKFEKRF